MFPQQANDKGRRGKCLLTQICHMAWFVGLGRPHLIIQTEYSNVDFTAEYGKNMVNEIVCIN